MKKVRRAILRSAGVISPFGDGLGRFWEGLTSGTSAMRVADPFGFGQGFSKKFGLISSRPTRALQIAIPAIDEAVRNARWSNLMGLHYGVYLSSAHGESQRLSEIATFGYNLLTPTLATTQIKPNLLHAPLTEDTLAQGIDDHLQNSARHVRVFKAACASGNLAMHSALGDIRRGVVDRAIVVGVDILSRVGIAGFANLGALATNDLLPFSRARDGTLIGEGAAAFCIDAVEADSEASGVEILSVGLSGDMELHPIQSSPSGVGIALSMTRALLSSGVQKSDIGAIFYHATGTPQNDAAEAAAVCRIFAQSVPPGFAIKSSIGHTMGAAPSMSLAAAFLSISAGILPSTVNGNRDTEFPNIFLPEDSTGFDRSKAILINGFGFGGINSCLILREAS